MVEGSDATTAMETERDDSVVVPLLSEAPLDADGSNVGRASVLSSTINLYVCPPPIPPLLSSLTLAGGGLEESAFRVRRAPKLGGVLGALALLTGVGGWHRLNTLVGAGMLALPYAFAVQGWALGIATLLLAALGSATGQLLLSICAQRLHSRSTSYGNPSPRATHLHAPHTAPRLAASPETDLVPTHHSTRLSQERWRVWHYRGLLSLSTPPSPSNASASRRRTCW